VGGQIVITRGVHELTGADVSGLLKALAAFGEFDADSDPHGERDFGLFDFAGRELMFKIDYYSDGRILTGAAHSFGAVEQAIAQSAQWHSRSPWDHSGHAMRRGRSLAGTASTCPLTTLPAAVM